MAFDAPFPQQPATSIVSYDFVDISDGTGVEIYYLATCQEGGGTGVAPTFNHILTRQAIEVGSGVGATAPKWSYISSSTKPSFELIFNVTKVAKGKAYFNFTYTTSSTSSADLTGTATIYKNSTSIGSQTFRINGTSQVVTVNLEIELTETIFRAGDTLKLVVEDSGTNPYAFIYHDPLNRDSGGGDLSGGGGLGTQPAVTASTNPTSSKINLPFKILE